LPIRNAGQVSDQLLFGWGYVRREHRSVPGIAVPHEHPSKVSPGLFARHFAGSQQTILTGSPNGSTCHRRVGCRDCFLRPTCLYAARKGFLDRVTTLNYRS
jgi:hypothetical protein